MSTRCKTGEMLKARVRADLKAYGDAITLLQQHSMAALSALDEPNGFKKAQKLAERARLAYQVSRQKLEKHVADHGCE